MDKPIRILHILQRMETGGTQALLMNIYRKIDREKVQFDFLVEYPNKEFYDDEITALGGKIYYSNVRKDFNILKFQKLLEKILIDNPEYKIVHVHTYSIGYPCLKVAKKCGVPIRIAHSHNNETVHDIKYLPKLFLQKIYTIHATDLFACSDEAGKYLFKNKKYKVLKNAIDSKKFIFNSKKREKIRLELNIENNFVVGHVGRFHPQKNHMFLLEVFSEIKKIKHNAKLILVGSGDIEEKIREKVKELQIEEDVLFLGNRNDMDFIYQAMDVFLFPSLFEGLGIVAVEAQAAGTPIVCSTNLPPETKLTTIYKQLSLEENAKKWANEAIKISEHENARKNMQKEIINSGFDIEAVAVEMQDFYINKYMENSKVGKKHEI